jgi:hypothetical protein
MYSFLIYLSLHFLVRLALTLATRSPLPAETISLPLCYVSAARLRQWLAERRAGQVVCLTMGLFIIRALVTDIAKKIIISII